VMIQLREWPWETIIFLLDVLKGYFGKVDESIFEGDEMSCELIFCNLGIQKNSLGRSRGRDDAIKTNVTDKI
jgi:hypothetical protein